MANSIATITRYLSDMIDSVFVSESKTEILENGSKFIDLNFKEAGMVKIYQMELDRLGNYWRANSIGEGAGSYSTGTRDGSKYSQYEGTYDAGYSTNPQRDGFPRGAVSGSWEVYKLRYYRAKQFLVDQMDDEETAGMIIGNILTEFMRRAVVPEVDAVRFSTLVDAARLGGEVATADYAMTGAGTTSIISALNEVFVKLVDKEVPEEDQVIFCSSVVWGLLLSDPTLTRFITQENYKSESGLEFGVKAYMGRPIIVVPEGRFFSDVALTDNGFGASSASKKINFIVCSKRAVVPVVKLDYNKIWEPSSVQDFIGYKINFAMYHDCFVPTNKKPAIYVSLAQTLTPTVNVVNVVDHVDASTSKVVIDALSTTPAGLRGQMMVLTGDGSSTGEFFTIGAAAPAGATAVAVGDELTAPSTSGDSLYFGLIANGVCIAKSGALHTAA